MEKKQKIKVYRTTEGTIFELTFLILAIVIWVFVIIMIKNAPDVIATHFDANGRPNGYGSPWGLMFPSIIMTVTGACLLAAAYFPHTINIPVEVKTPRQYELLIRMVRIAAIIMLLMTLAIPASLLIFRNPTPWPILGTAGLLLLEMIVFCVLIHKAGQPTYAKPQEKEKKKISKKIHSIAVAAQVILLLAALILPWGSNDSSHKELIRLVVCVGIGLLIFGILILIKRRK